MSAETGDSNENGYHQLRVNLSDAEDINRHLSSEGTVVALVGSEGDEAREKLNSEKVANYLRQALTESNKADSYGDLPDPANLSRPIDEQTEDKNISLWMDIDDSDSPYTVGYSMMAPVDFEGDRYDLEFATRVMTGQPQTVQDIHDLTEREDTEIAQAYEAVIEELEEN